MNKVTNKDLEKDTDPLMAALCCLHDRLFILNHFSLIGHFLVIIWIIVIIVTDVSGQWRNDLLLFEKFNEKHW